MNEFKIGDEVWFTYYEGHGLPILCNQLIEIRKGIFVGNQHEELDIYYEREIIHALESELFKTKHEAIDAMIARLQELKHE